MAHIVELIYTTEYRGMGTEKDPARTVQQLYTKSGYIVAEHDPATDKSWFSPHNSHGGLEADDRQL